MSDKCPVCETELERVPGIGLVCPKEGCPVIDDPNCWDWNGNYTPPPPIVFYRPDDAEKLELKRQRDALLAFAKAFSEYVHAERCATDGPVTYSSGHITALAFQARAAIAACESNAREGQTP